MGRRCRVGVLGHGGAMWPADLSSTQHHHTRQMIHLHLSSFTGSLFQRETPAGGTLNCQYKVKLSLSQTKHEWIKNIDFSRDEKISYINVTHLSDALPQTWRNDSDSSKMIPARHYAQKLSVSSLAEHLPSHPPTNRPPHTRLRGPTLICYWLTPLECCWRPALIGSEWKGVIWRCPGSAWPYGTEFCSILSPQETQHFWPHTRRALPDWAGLSAGTGWLGNGRLTEHDAEGWPNNQSRKNPTDCFRSNQRKRSLTHIIMAL